MTKHTFEPALIKAKFIKRYKRFFVDAESENGEILVAHCANTGSMKGLLNEGAYCYLRDVADPSRKLKYSFEMVDAGDSLVGVNTSIPNKMVFDAIEAGDVEELTGYASAKREVKYGKEGKSRIDVLLDDPKKGKCYVEVKNTTLREGNAAQFPDAVTARGLKHLEELIAEVENGNRAVMFYFTQRSDCTYFEPADAIDPAYSAKLREAVKKGVEVLCYQCLLTPESITLDKKLEVRI